MNLFFKNNIFETYYNNRPDFFREKILENPGKNAEEEFNQNSFEDYHSFNFPEENLNKIVSSIVNKNDFSIINKIIKFSNEENENKPTTEKGKYNSIGNIKNQKFIGKKRTGKFIGRHNKYSPDNLYRKIKNSLILNLTDFINNLIKKIYNGKIGNGMLKKELKRNSQIKNTNVEEHKGFIYKSLKDIFSDDLSGKFTFFLKDHNKKLINELLNETDKEKRKIFEKIFSLTFMKCMEHFTGKKKIKELEGLNSLDKAFNNEENDYFEYIKEYANNFEQYIMNQKSRKRGKNAAKINEDLSIK